MDETSVAGFSLEPLVRTGDGVKPFEPEKKATAFKQDPLEQMRKVCANQMHMSVRALLEPSFRSCVCMICDILDAPRVMHLTYYFLGAHQQLISCVMHALLICPGTYSTMFFTLELSSAHNPFNNFHPVPQAGRLCTMH